MGPEESAIYGEEPTAAEGEAADGPAAKRRRTDGSADAEPDAADEVHIIGPLWIAAAFRCCSFQCSWAERVEKFERCSAAGHPPDVLHCFSLVHVPPCPWTLCGPAAAKQSGSWASAVPSCAVADAI